MPFHYTLITVAVCGLLWVAYLYSSIQKKVGRPQSYCCQLQCVYGRQLQCVYGRWGVHVGVVPTVIVDGGLGIVPSVIVGGGVGVVPSMTVGGVGCCDGVCGRRRWLIIVCYK